MRPHVARAIDEGRTPASVADAVFEAVAADQFWVIPHQDFLDIAVDRWDTIRERANPVRSAQAPGMPPFEQLQAEIASALGLPTP